MEGFWQIAAGVMLAVVVGIALGKENRDVAQVLAIVACCMVAGAALSYLEPILDFIGELQDLGQLDPQVGQIMFKSVGLGIVAEIAVLICNDSGNAALGKTLQILAAVTILWMALPLMQSLMELVQTIMGEV